MSKKVSPPPNKNVINLPVFLGFNKVQAVKSLQTIRDSLTDIMITALDEDASLNDDTISFVKQVYFEATGLLGELTAKETKTIN